MKKVIKCSLMSGNVGIWWYTEDGTVWGKIVPTESGELSGVFIQFSNDKNHMTEWRSVVRDNIPDKETADKIISKGYKHIPRGRVIFDTRTNTYCIICQDSLKDDKEFKSRICQFFDIPEGRTYVDAISSHYYVYELTGNPALDEFEYGI